MKPHEPQILVAGVGNSWLQDDGFGSKVIEALDGATLPTGVTLLDSGTGGLDLAYELMRGYDALVLVDVSRQGGEPGTLYVMEPDPAEIKPIADGEVINPHGMDPAAGPARSRSSRASPPRSRRWVWSSRPPWRQRSSAG